MNCRLGVEVDETESMRSKQVDTGPLAKARLVSVISASLPSSVRRLWVIQADESVQSVRPIATQGVVCRNWDDES